MADVFVSYSRRDAEAVQRIVPLVLRPVPDGDVPEGIRVRNWIPIAGDPGG